MVCFQNWILLILNVSPGVAMTHFNIFHIENLIEQDLSKILLRILHDDEDTIIETLYQ